MSNLEKQLAVGTKIRLGPEFCRHSNDTFKPGHVIELIEGTFDHENGLYTEQVYAPAIWNKEQHEFDSIYHLFGNDLEDFLDCEIIR